jgi:hypothetical protein
MTARMARDSSGRGLIRFNATWRIASQSESNTYSRSAESPDPL